MQQQNPLYPNPTAGSIMHMDMGAMNLPVVDPYESPYVWCIVDEGCNACTHSKEWMDNAREKWHKLGFDAYRLSLSSTTFNGVGTGQTSGKHKIPHGSKMEESGLILPGALDSHEMDNGAMCCSCRNQCRQSLDFSSQSAMARSCWKTMSIITWR